MVKVKTSSGMLKDGWWNKEWNISDLLFLLTFLAAFPNVSCSKLCSKLFHLLICFCSSTADMQNVQWDLSLYILHIRNWTAEAFGVIGVVLGRTSYSLCNITLNLLLVCLLFPFCLKRTSTTEATLIGDISCIWLWSFRIQARSQLDVQWSGLQLILSNDQLVKV